SRNGCWLTVWMRRASRPERSDMKGRWATRSTVASTFGWEAHDDADCCCLGFVFVWRGVVLPGRAHVLARLGRALELAHVHLAQRRAAGDARSLARAGADQAELAHAATRAELRAQPQP